MPKGKLSIATLSLSIIFLETFICIDPFFPFLSIVRVTVESGGPFICRLKPSIPRPLTGELSTFVITSPARTPASAAGLPSIGAIMMNFPSNDPISIPIPPNLPDVFYFNSA